MYRRRRLARILRLAHQLPQASRFKAAIATNPDHVEQIVAATGGQQSEYSPPLATWGTTNDQLASANEKLDGLISVVIGLAGGKPREAKPSPRPRTAFPDAMMKVRKARHKQLVAKVLRRSATTAPTVD